MTLAADRHDAGPPAPIPAPEVDAIVGQVAAADARRKLRFRLIFIATWVIVVGGLVAFLVAVDAVDLAWLQPWVWYILGGVPLTILISIVSILLAIVFALLGAMGRISTVAPVYALATLYVSIVRGTPLHRADLLRLAGTAPDLARLRHRGPHLAGHLRAQLQLRRLYDGDLPGRHPSRAAWSARGRRGPGPDAAAHHGPDRAPAGRAASSRPPSATSSSP